MTKEIVNQPHQIHCSSQYDPNHPDADWSGFVERRTSRKHIPSNPNQLLAIDGNAFGPAENVPTAEWTRPAKKIVGHRESGAKVDGSSTFSLIGGPVPSSSPEKFSPKCWKTEAQSANQREKTELEQLTDRGRSKHIRGRKPMAEGSEKIMHELKDSSTTCASDVNVSKDPNDFIGFRTSNVTVTCSDSTFLKEVGDAVAKLRGSPLVTATAFDPYQTASGDRRKDLLYENFSTRKRTFIS